MKNPTLLVVVAAILGVMLLPVPQSGKLALIFLLLLVVIYVKRGYVYVALASRILNAKVPNEAKAWRLYEQGWKAGLPSHYTVMLGNLFVQRGDAATALQIFDSVIAKEQDKRQSDGEIIASARVSRSMALWVLGQEDEAIASLLTLREEGRLDKNLVINLGSYLLDKGRLEEAGALIEEAAEGLPESPGMTDNRGLHLLLTGALLDAQSLYDKLLSEGTPRFPEAYVHAARVKMALGKNSQAVQLLNSALERPFYQTSTVAKTEVETLLRELSNRPDSNESDEDPVDGSLESALYEEDLFDDESPNTELDDDDNTEPNIELDPEDYDDEEEDPEVEIEPDEISELESELFEDEYEDEDEEENQKK